MQKAFADFIGMRFLSFFPKSAALKVAVAAMKPVNDLGETQCLVEALALPAGEQRARYLERVCQGDDDLLRSLESSIFAIEAVTGGRPSHLPLSMAFAGSGEAAESVVGAFTLEEKIGEGGFGLVYAAAQAYPVKRRAALKLLRPGMDSLQVLQRFERERQLLSRLEHPNIASFYDAGTTEEGRPWVAMELIEGREIASFCREEGLGLAERLGLMMQVCEAVHHANIRGIIHRDLKPSNILVAKGDLGEPVSKVIDFGVARLLESDSAAETLLTLAGQVVGTPAFMSPEQVRVGDGDVDIRADVYALGAILYLLVCGEPVFSAERTRDLSLLELAGLINEEVPLKPGERLRRAGAGEDSATGILEPVPRDLDLIVMKALEKDRERRYATAIDLARDLAAFLEKRPIEARPPSWSYLLSRFSQRHRAEALAIGVVIIAVFAALIVSTTLYFSEIEARLAADQEAAKSQELARFLTDTLEAAGPEVSKGRDATVMKEILEQASERIETELENQPSVAALMHHTLGKTFREIGDLEGAESHSRDAVALHRAVSPGGSVELAESLEELSITLIRAGKFRAAVAPGEEAARLYAEFPGNDPFESDGALVETLYARARSGEGREIEAEARLFFEKWRDHPENPNFDYAPNVLATVLMTSDRADEAIAVYEESLDTLRRRGLTDTLIYRLTLDNLGSRLSRTSRLDEAEEILLEAIALSKRLVGERDSSADHIYASLARVEKKRGNFDKSLDYAREAKAAAERAFPEGHLWLEEGRATLGDALLDRVETLVLEVLSADLSGVRINAKREAADQYFSEIQEADGMEGFRKVNEFRLGTLDVLRALDSKEDAVAFLSAAGDEAKVSEADQAWIEAFLQQLR